jgi:hypothetical protein
MFLSGLGFVLKFKLFRYYKQTSILQQNSTNSNLIFKKCANNVQEVLNQGIETGWLYAYGFGLCGIPENSTAELVKKRNYEFNVFQTMRWFWSWLLLQNAK